MRGGGQQDETWLLEYDVLGNLLSVRLPNGDLVEYLVDGVGRRVGKKKNGALIKQWIYRDALKPVAELDGAGNLVAQFVYASKGHVPDYVFRNGAIFRVISDHLGSPRYVVNVASASDAPFRATYTSFGEVNGVGLDWMPFGFAGGFYDGDTGLIRFGARDYDPKVGRWTAKDPIRFGGGQGNLYGYTFGDPISLHDPTGLYGFITGAGVEGQFLWNHMGYERVNFAPFQGTGSGPSGSIAGTSTGLNTPQLGIGGVGFLGFFTGTGEQLANTGYLGLNAGPWWGIDLRVLFGPDGTFGFSIGASLSVDRFPVTFSAGPLVDNDSFVPDPCKCSRSSCELR